MRRMCLLLLLALLGRGPAPAASGGGWRELAPGLGYRAVGQGESSTQMHQVRLDPVRFRLGLLVSPQGPEPIAKLVAGTKALVAVNGGYFDKAWQPLGYLRDGSRQIVPEVATGNAFTGVFYVDKAGPRVVLREDFHPGGESLAIQCGPRLVADGRAVTGFAANQPRRRTGIGVDRDGRIVLFATGMAGNFTLEETQKILLGPADRGGVNPRGVLNLDGGSSTQMIVRAGGVNLELLGYTGVPVAVGVFSR